MSNLKRGIAIFVLLIVAISSLFAIQTISLKVPASTVSAVKKNAVNTNIGLSVNGGFAFFGTYFMSPRFNTNVVSPDYFNFEGKIYGINAGVKYNGLYGDISLGFFGDGRFTAENWYGEPLSSFARLYGGSYRVNFFSISAGYSRSFNLSLLNMSIGVGATFNRGGYKLNSTEFNIKTVFSNIAVNGLVDIKFFVTGNIGVGIKVNPQLTLYNYSNINVTKGNLNIKLTGRESNLSFAVPVVVGVTYRFY